MNIKEVRETADTLFSKRSTLLSLWQELAENFYPERADFTLRRVVGYDFAANLSTSYPVYCRRDLGDQLGVMLRPTQKSWFHMKPVDTQRESQESLAWLQWAETVQRRAMYDRVTQFTRATKEGDHDFATFGQCCIEVRLNRAQDALLYRSWHLRDVAWMENDEGQIGFIARKWKPTNIELWRIFGGKNHNKIQQDREKNPFAEVNCYHFVMEADMYEKDSKGRKYWSIYYDVDHDHVIEEVSVHTKQYVIPRWQTVSGYQYSYSPAAIIALPDARLLQSMTVTLLEAGEKATNPPIVATENVVRSDVALYAGGITWVDEAYDERLGEALRPLQQDFRGLPIGVDMQRDSREMLIRAFYLNKLSMPATGKEMTAYETAQRVQEYIRAATPLFEPMEMDYNGALCDETFNVLMRGGAFGSPYNMPEELQGADIQFRFESPLHDAIEQIKGQKFVQTQQLLSEAAAIDQTAPLILNAQKALRDTLNGIGIPASWLKSDTDYQAAVQQQKDKIDTERMLSNMKTGSEAVKNVGQSGVLNG